MNALVARLVFLPLAASANGLLSGCESSPPHPVLALGGSSGATNGGESSSGAGQSSDGGGGKSSGAAGESSGGSSPGTSDGGADGDSSAGMESDAGQSSAGQPSTGGNGDSGGISMPIGGTGASPAGAGGTGEAGAGNGGSGETLEALAALYAGGESDFDGDGTPEVTTSVVGTTRTLEFGGTPPTLVIRFDGTGSSRSESDANHDGIADFIDEFDAASGVESWWLDRDFDGFLEEEHRSELSADLESYQHLSWQRTLDANAQIVSTLVVDETVGSTMLQTTTIAECVDGQHYPTETATRRVHGSVWAVAARSPLSCSDERVLQIQKAITDMLFTGEAMCLLRDPKIAAAFFRALASEEVKVRIACGIPRDCPVLGYTQARRRNGVFALNLNEKLFDDPTQLRNTLMHELLHVGGWNFPGRGVGEAHDHDTGQNDQIYACSRYCTGDSGNDAETRSDCAICSASPEQRADCCAPDANGSTTPEAPYGCTDMCCEHECIADGDEKGECCAKPNAVCGRECTPLGTDQNCGGCGDACDTEQCMFCSDPGDGSSKCLLKPESECTPRCDPCHTAVGEGSDYTCVAACNSCEECVLKFDASGDTRAARWECSGNDAALSCGGECCSGGTVCESAKCVCPAGQILCDDVCLPAPCPAKRRANTWGDPHLVTLDGVMFDFQQVGEFVLATDEADFVVQVRQTPFLGTSRTLSSNSAIAVNVAGDRVGVYAEDADKVWINGLPVARGSIALPQGGRIATPNANNTTILWPGGDELRVMRVGASKLLNISIAAGPTRSLRGLLGNGDGDRTNDFELRGGGGLGSSPTREDLHRRFGDSWRVSDEESLFDYEPGQSTETFTDQSFPDAPVHAASLPPDVYARARAACKTAQISDPALLDACILDVGASNDPTFANASPPPPATPLTPALIVEDGVISPESFTWITGVSRPLPATDAWPAVDGHGPVAAAASVQASGALPAHQTVSVSFELHVIGAWQGDPFRVTVGPSDRVSSFSNTSATQSFPDIMGGSYPGQTASIAVDTVGSEPRAIYRVKRVFGHADSTLQIDFGGPTSAGRDFIIDNLSVALDAPALTWTNIPDAPSSCLDILQSGAANEDGVYTLKLQDASHLVELPVFCDMTRDGGGWTLVYKKSAGVASEPYYDIWNQAPVNERRLELLDRNRAALEYSSSLINHAWSNFQEARVEVISDSTVVKMLRFDTTQTTKTTWFSPIHQRASSYSDLPTAANWEGSANGRYFSLTGAGTRSFYINSTWGGCSNDSGWLMVTTRSTCNQWEVPHSIYYSILTTVGQLSNPAQFRAADALVIMLR